MHMHVIYAILQNCHFHIRCVHMYMNVHMKQSLMSEIVRLDDNLKVMS